VARSPLSNYAYAILTANALRSPDKVALTYCGGTALTYDRLNRKVNQVAQMKLGSVVCTLNPYWPEETLARVVERSGCTAFVYDASVDGLVEAVRPKLPAVTLWLRVGGPAEGATDLGALASAAPEEEPPLGGHGDDLMALRAIVLGGEPLLPSLREKIMKRLPGTRIFSYYGQTEAPYTCIGRQDDGSQDISSVGRARTSTAVRITGPDGERVVGEVGEINLTGPNLMQGYDGQPDRTAEVLRDGWYVGGDLGIMDSDGYVTVLGRREDSILKVGVWSQPAHLEEAAIEVDGVAEASVAGVPAHAEGKDAVEQRILIAVVPHAGAVLDPGAVKAELGERLPAHQAPDVVVVAEELPHTHDASGGPGKLLRREIRTRYADRLQQS
jgi:acyl-CoA synthetase (AMP-forming)/AMP-acid ligase II